MLALLLALVAVQAAPQEPTTERGVGLAGEPVGQLPSSGYRRRHGLVIGIDGYEDASYPDLAHAVADARAVAKILVERYGFKHDDVQLILDQDATKVGLETALEEWACDPARVGPNDLLVVFFAGHGVTRTSPRGNRGYLAPVDAGSNARLQPAWSSLLGMGDLEDISELIPAKHVLFIIDACFSGLAVSRSAPPVAAGLSNRARQVITAGNADQQVLDTGGGGHSVFTGALLGALRGDADLDSDQVITFGELFNHVGREVERKTERRQTPLQASFPDHEGGNVALFPPGVKPGQMTAAERLRTLEGTLEERLAELERVSDFILVHDLVEEADKLWPAHPEIIPRYREWIARARELVERNPQHEASVRQVRQEAYLSQVVAGELEESEGTEPVWARVGPKLRWRHETFVELVARLDALEAGLLADDAVTEEHGWSVPRRLSFAVRLEVGFAAGGEFAQLWESALPSINAAYFELDLEPQLGLVPIGPDPVSGLWEFAHVLTGEPAEREAAGKLILTEETGVVLVLVPGERFWMGAQSSDPRGRNYDPQARADEGPVHEVELSAYFLSKYEMTQAQWRSHANSNPSYFRPPNGPSLINPVESVSWEDCMQTLSHLGLTLPTEAQWEYAARSGTETPWWTGEEKESLLGTINIADRALKRMNERMPSYLILDWPELDDRWATHAPVSFGRPNHFGLLNAHGNVWEWCRNPFEQGPDDGRRPVRGGGFNTALRDSRSATRLPYLSSRLAPDVGVRPARAIDP
jgi:formylglycine-generating enzyme required for sulfatase activity